MKYPAFVDNETFYRLDRSKSQMDQLIGMSENLKKVHQLASNNYGSFEDLIHSYLQAGIEIFQMETGIVSRITEDKQYIVKDVVTPLEVLNPGAVFELEGTYCREVYKTLEVIGLPHVGEIEEMKGHPVYQNLKLEAYISAPIFVNNKLYGTFNFTSTTPREYGFSEHEMDLISLMSTSIGSFILLQEKEDSLIGLNERLKALVGHVSHDLRNPLGVIGNLAKLISSVEMDQADKDHLIERIQKNSERCLELVNTILDIAALGSGKISINKQRIDLIKTIEESLENYQVFASENAMSIDTDLPHELFIEGDEARLLQALNNLISNAIKYGAPNSSIELSCRLQDDNKAAIEVRNAIATDIISVNKNKASSIGFGLDITREVLALHAADLDIQRNAQTFCATVSIPLQ